MTNRATVILTDSALESTMWAEEWRDLNYVLFYVLSILSSRSLDFIPLRSIPLGMMQWNQEIPCLGCNGPACLAGKVPTLLRDDNTIQQWIPTLLRDDDAIQQRISRLLLPIIILIPRSGSQWRQWYASNDSKNIGIKISLSNDYYHNHGDMSLIEVFYLIQSWNFYRGGHNLRISDKYR